MKNLKPICCVWSLLVLALCLSICQMSMADVLRIPEGTKVIEEEAFYGDTSLDEVVLPDGIQEIGPRAFAGSSVRSIFLPASIIKIADEASPFEQCSEALVARVYENSYAHQWCIEHNVNFVITSQDKYSQVYALFDELRLTARQYENADGTIISGMKDQALDAIYNLLVQKSQNGSVSNVEKSESAVFYTENILDARCVFVPRSADTLLGGDLLEVYTFQPNKYQEAENDCTAISVPSFDSVVSELKGLRKIYSYKGYPTNSQVTLNALDSLSKNQIVIWIGHGITGAHGYINTGIRMSNEEFCNSELEKYRGEYYLYDPANERVWINDEYIKDHMNSLQGSFVWLGACHGGESGNSIANALHSKGATVVGFDEELTVDYHDEMLETTLMKMCEMNPDTNQYYTLLEALKYAERENGAKDPNICSSDKKHHYAKATPFGDYQFIEHIPLELRVVEFRNHNKAIDNAEVRIVDRENGNIISGVTNQQGYFSQELFEGRYHISVTHAEYGKYDEDLILVRSVNNDYTILMDSEVRLFGTVKDAMNNDQLLSNAEIKLTNTQSGDSCTTNTDENGNYAIEAWGAEYELTCTRDGYKDYHASIDIRGATEYEYPIEMEPLSGFVTGYVVENTVSGPAIEDAMIFVTDSNGGDVIIDKPNSWTTTHSGGIYMFAVEPGTYTLTVSKDGYESETATITVQPGKTIEQDFALTPSGRLQITFDGNGGTVSNEIITVIKGNPVGELPTATNGDKRLKEWNTDPDGNGLAITSSYIPDRDMTVYAIWNERGTVYEGQVFQCLSSNYVQGVTVELHRGAKQVTYYNERIAGGCASGETEITEREIVPYESEIIDSCVTDSNGHYTLYLPFDGEPNYTSYDELFYAYTFVFRKDGWITKYSASAFRNEEEVARHSPYIYALAPEGEGIRYEVTIPSVGTQSSIIHPYSSYEFSYLGNMYSATYDVSRVSLYMNGAYRVGYSAPRYVSETNWRLGFYSDGYFYLVNKTYKDTYPSGSYLYPSWANK